MNTNKHTRLLRPVFLVEITIEMNNDGLERWCVCVCCGNGATLAVACLSAANPLWYQWRRR